MNDDNVTFDSLPPADPKKGAGRRAVVIGGGLAGITTSLVLAERGWQVTLVEARPRLGGRATSYRRGDLTVDNGQHVFLRCCTAYRGLLERLGAGPETGMTHLQDQLDIPIKSAADGTVARLKRNRMPAPLHLARALGGYGLLPLADRAKLGGPALALRRTNPADPKVDEQGFGPFLRKHRQSKAAIDRLWSVISTATLNINPDDASLALAAKVFRTGLLERADGSDLGYALVPLGQIHDEMARKALEAAGVTVLDSTKAEPLTPDNNQTPQSDNQTSDNTTIADELGRSSDDVTNSGGLDGSSDDVTAGSAAERGGAESARQVSGDPVSARRVGGEQVSTGRVSGEQVSAGQVSGEQVSVRQVSAGQVSAGQVSGRGVTSVTSVRSVRSVTVVGRSGERTQLPADAVVLAVPHDVAATLLPEPHPTDFSRLGHSPILNIHVRYDRPVLDGPFLAAVDSPAQWIFDRTAASGVSGPAGSYLAITVSAADSIADLPTKELASLFSDELARLLPQARSARVEEVFVTREQHATFRQARGSAALRPGPASGMPGVYLAGAWTATGWPDTMESAVRSGIYAARLVVDQTTGEG